MRNDLGDEEANKFGKLLATLDKHSGEEVAADRQLLLQAERFRAERAKFDPAELQCERRELRDKWSEKSKELREAVEAERIAHGAFKAAEMKCERFNEWGVRLAKLEREHPELFE